MLYTLPSWGRTWKKVSKRRVRERKHNSRHGREYLKERSCSRFCHSRQHQRSTLPINCFRSRLSQESHCITIFPKEHAVSSESQAHSEILKRVRPAPGFSDSPMSKSDNGHRARRMPWRPSKIEKIQTFRELSGNSRRQFPLASCCRYRTLLIRVYQAQTASIPDPLSRVDSRILAISWRSHITASPPCSRIGPYQGKFPLKPRPSPPRDDTNPGYTPRNLRQS